MDHFEFNGDLYREASAHQREWGTRVIDGLELDDHASILDLGCGDGMLTKALDDRVKHGFVIGIDASLGMIKKARELPVSNCEFRQADINEMMFENQFDLIYSNAALHWVFDHQRLLDNCYRALKPGGGIRFNFGARENCETLYRVIKSVMSQEEFSPLFSEFQWPWYMPSAEEYRMLLRSKPFKAVSVWIEDTSRFFKKEEDMVRWIDQPCLVPFLKRLEGQKKEDFRNTVVKKMIREAKQPDGTCFEKFYRINVKARKPEYR